MEERSHVVYVTADSARWVRIDLPHGLIPPPTLLLHQPLVGPEQFYYAEYYRLPVPAEAKLDLIARLESQVTDLENQVHYLTP